VSSATSASRPGPYGTGDGFPVARGLPAPPRQRGLTARAAVVLALALSLIGAGIDLLGGNSLDLGFAVCFVLGCVLAVCTVRRSGLKTVAFAPPLVYAGVALLIGLVVGNVPRTVVRQAIELGTVLVIGAPALLIAVVLVVLVALLRAASAR